VGDVRPRLADVAAHLAHHADVVVAVEQVVLVLTRSGASACAVRRLVRLEGGVAEHDNQALRVLVAGGDGRVLFGNQLGQLWRRHRLRSWRDDGLVSTVSNALISVTVNIRARFLPRSGESREECLSAGDSGLSGPGMARMCRCAVAWCGTLLSRLCGRSMNPVCGVQQ
jgi:hypothetical protein